MPSDRTRSSDDHRQGYRGITAQQGRVILDRDIDALQTSLGEELRRETLDIVGPCGTPDNGFEIGLPAPASLPRPARPERRFILASPPPQDPFDFTIGPGTMYVGGLRAVLPPPAYTDPPVSYDHQPDWLSPPPPDPDPPLIEFICLDVARQEVSATEDDDLRDVALGGPDTTGRIRLMQRVRRIGVADGTCGGALADAVAAWGRAGFALDQESLRLTPLVLLKVGFSDVEPATSPCEPGSTGGYLGADNQLIRVMITGAGTLVWGFDNAAFLYTVTAQPDRKTLRLAQVPVDAYHRPARNQAVEVLRGAAVLPNGAVVAEATGRITTLAAPYDGESVVLTDPLTDAEAADPHLFLRIWQETAPFVSGRPVILGATGLTVTLQLPQGATPGAALSVGAYWMIAVRPSTPQLVYPGRLLEEFQVADGPERWICPLAVIDWTASPGPLVTDCRSFFDNLVELSRRRSGGCCTITLRPADLADDDPMRVINRLIEAAGARATDVTVCLAEGAYKLVKPFRLTARHGGMTIQSCAGPATLMAANPADPDFLDGLIVLNQTSNVTLRGLELLPPAVPFGPAIIARQAPNARIVAGMVSRLGNVVGMIGVRVLQSAAVTIDDCLFGFDDPDGTAPFAVGIFPSGACPGLTVTDCRFAGAAAPILQVVAGRPQPIVRSLRDRLLATAAVRPARAAAATPTTTPTGTTAAAALSHVMASAATERFSALFGEGLSRAAFDNQRFSARFGLGWATALTFAEGQGGATDEQIVLPARIDALAVTGCAFTRVTAAALTIADTGTARFQANTLTDSDGGFWVDSTGLGPKLSVPLFNRNLAGMETLLSGGDASALFGLLMLLLYPLPSAAAADANAEAPLPRLVFADNQLAALPADGSQSGPGLVVLTTALDTMQDPDAVVTVSGNQVTNRAAATVAAAGVFVGPRGALVISGNLFANLQPPAQVPAGVAPTPPPCLLIEVSVVSAGPPLPSGLAVSGNTLRGGNNLDQNLRPGFAAPLNTWAFANAVIA